MRTSTKALSWSGAVAIRAPTGSATAYGDQGAQPFHDEVWHLVALPQDQRRRR